MQWPAGDPWQDVCDYGWWLKKHNLTPQQVDQLPAWFEVRFKSYSAVWDEVVAERRQG